MSKSNNEMLVAISAWIMKKDNTMIKELAKKYSPRTLTTVGKELYETSGAKEVLEGNMDFFIAELAKEKPLTAYDVEEKSLSVLGFNLSLELFNPIKHYLYNAPEELEFTDDETKEIKSITININGVLLVMSLNLRDEYLRRNPQIK